MFQGSSERIEMVVDIYDSADGTKDRDSNAEYEDTERSIEAQQTGGDRWYTLIAACVVLCVLLLTSITLLWMKYNTINTECGQLQTSCNNLTIERDQLQTSNNNLTTERNQLQRDEYPRTFCDLAGTDKRRCFNFSSSFYFLSDEKKNWTESRQDCRDKGADLVIINIMEEQEFIIEQLNGGQAWIGLGINKNGTWKWVDDTLPMIKSWAVGEQNKNNDKNCAEIHTLAPKGWHYKHCFEQGNFICEKCLSK